MDDALKAQITEQLFELVAELAPDATLRAMYGGTVIELIRDDPKSRVGGVYAYADYVSLELANGFEFDDPDRVLEGKGKKRRHVKLRSLADLDVKNSQEFLKQAIWDP